MHTPTDIDGHLQSGTASNDFHPTAHKELLRGIVTATTVKTGAYTAAVQELVICDSTSAAFTVTLPAAPVDGSRIQVKKIDATTNVVTIARGGSSDVFNKAGGSTSLTLTYANQLMTLQYVAATGVWIVADALSAASQGRGWTYTAGNWDGQTGTLATILAAAPSWADYVDVPLA